MARTLAVLLGTVSFTCACASAGGASSEALASAEQLRPVELGCPYSEPANAAQAPYRVALQYLVRSDGTVEESSIVVRQSPRNDDLQYYVARAREIAKGCVYEPAVEAGKPVEAMVRKRFYFSD